MKVNRCARRRHLTLVRLSAAAAIALCLDSAPVLAQRSGGGLFGATRGRESATEGFNVTFNVGGAIDSDTPDDFSGRVPRGSQFGGFSTMFDASAQYGHVSRHVEVRATGEGGVRHYASAAVDRMVSYSGGVGLTFKMPGRSSLELSQTLAYSPAYWFQLFPSLSVAQPGDSIPIAQDYRVTPNNSLSSATSAAFRVGSDRGLTFNVTGDYNRSDFDGAAAYSNFNGHSVQTNVSHGVSRNGHLRFKYGYRVLESPLYDSSTQQSLGGGFDVSRAISRSNRVTTQFDVRVTTLRQPASSSADIFGGERQYRIGADASLIYLLRRSWTISGTYRRDFHQIAGLTSLVFADSARFGLSGLLIRRMDLDATVAYADGESALAATQKLRGYTGDVRSRYALNRTIAVLGQYVYYRYDLLSERLVAEGLRTQFRQHGLRLGVVVWLGSF